MKRLLKCLAFLLVVTVTAVVVVPNFLPRSVFYRQGRPTRLGMLFVRGFAAWSALGLPPHWSITLEVTGKRTGKVYTIPLVVGAYDGGEYLVSMMGNDVAWVRNVHANEGRAVILHGGRHPVTLEDVPVADRAPILRAYLRRAMGARPHFPIAWDAPLVEFEHIGADYPAFRIVR